MVKFRKKYDLKPIVINTEAGTDIVSVFALNDSETAVIKVGEKSIVDEINSFKDATDFNVIKKQLMCGNQTIAEAFKSGMFAAPESYFGDSTIAPEYFTEYKKIMRDAISKYNNLPKEIRDNFASVDEFINASDDTIKGIIDKYNTTLAEQSASGIVLEKEGESIAE